MTVPFYLASSSVHAHVREAVDNPIDLEQGIHLEAFPGTGCIISNARKLQFYKRLLLKMWFK